MVKKMAIHEIKNNPNLSGQVRLIENVVYAAADGEALKLELLTPLFEINLFL